MIDKENSIEEGEDEMKKELIESKFYLAGYCARWFFGFSFENAKTIINRYDLSAQNMKTYVIGSAAVQSGSTVHHLLAVF